MYIIIISYCIDYFMVLTTLSCLDHMPLQSISFNDCHRQGGKGVCQGPKMSSKILSLQLCIVEVCHMHILPTICVAQTNFLEAFRFSELLT